MTLSLLKSPEWHAERRKGIGGSDAAAIMNGDWQSLWEIKTGRSEPEDLSHVLPVQMGIVTEPLNLAWFERIAKKQVIASGQFRQSERYPFMRCTLDGITNETPAAIVQAKHVNAFAKIHEVVQKYQPQIHHEMAVCDLARTYLSVFVGTMTYEWVEVERDDFYLATLIDREKAFWDLVERDEPPPSLGPIASPPAPTKFRTVSMDGNNFWAEQASMWLKHKDGAKAFDKAVKEIKSLIELDVGEASGHGIFCKRAKNGALTIKEL